MDCNCNQQSYASCRPQMPPPYTSHMNCGCAESAVPLPAPIRPIMPVMPIKPSTGTTPAMTPYMNHSSMPIGMTYVPWQQWSQIYPMNQALERGTIFQELDFPFVMGRCR